MIGARCVCVNEATPPVEDVTCMLVRRVSIDDKPSGKRKGEGKPGGSACPASDNLS